MSDLEPPLEKSGYGPGLMLILNIFDINIKIYNNNKIYIMIFQYLSKS